jgi:hypothetical protein
LWSQTWVVYTRQNQDVEKSPLILGSRVASGNEAGLRQITKVTIKPSQHLKVREQPDFLGNRFSSRTSRSFLRVLRG